MKQHELKPKVGAHRRSRRIGRGNGSRPANYSGRGRKGQKPRSAGSIRPGLARGRPPRKKPRLSEQGQAEAGNTKIQMPGPSYFPILVALGLMLGAYGLIYQLSLAVVGLLIALVAIYSWAFEPVSDEPAEH